MSSQTWQETLITAQVDGTALTNTTTATSILPGQAKYTLPANFLAVEGQGLRIRATGRISNTATVVTLILSVRFGATSVAVSPTWSMINSAKTNVAWMLDIGMTLRAVGATANLLTVGQFISEAYTGSVANVASTAMWPLSAPAVGSNFDSTVAQQVDLFAQWGTAAAGNSIQLHSFALESMN